MSITSSFVTKCPYCSRDLIGAIRKKLAERETFGEEMSFLIKCDCGQKVKVEVRMRRYIPKFKDPQQSDLPFADKWEYAKA